MNHRSKLFVSTGFAAAAAITAFISQPNDNRQEIAINRCSRKISRFMVIC